MSGTTGNRNAKTGVISLTIPFHVDSLDEVLSVGLEPPFGLQEMERDWDDIEGAGFEVAVKYEGFESGRDEGGVEYDFDPSFSEEPIESHPLINRLVELYDGEVKDNKVTFPSTIVDEGGGLGGGNGERKNPLAGLTTFVSLRSVFRMTYARRTLPQSIFRKIGTIERSLPGGFPTPAGRDWLVMPPKVSERGNAYEISEEWMMSPPGGWPENIYKLIEI